MVNELVNVLFYVVCKKCFVWYGVYYVCSVFCIDFKVYDICVYILVVVEMDSFLIEFLKCYKVIN